MQKLFGDSLRTVKSSLVLLLSLLILSGCGSSRDEFVFTGDHGGPGPVPVLNTLTVNLDTAQPVNGRISGSSTQFVVSLYDADKEELEENTINRGQNSIFRDLPDGDYWVRVLGLDAQGNIIGYFDRAVSLPAESSITISSLIYTNNPPAVGSLTSPFLTFNQFPDEAVAGAPFSVGILAFNPNGTPFTTASDTVSLTVTGATFTEAPAPVALSNGAATFTAVAFTTDSVGPAVLTANSAGLGSAVSPAIAISPAPEQPFLVFTAVPQYVISEEAFPSAVTVEARTQDDELIQEEVQVTLALASEPAPPEGAALGGTLTATTVDGVATFSGLTFSPGGEFALMATAPGFEPDTSETITSELPFNFMVVGEYDLDAFLTFDLNALMPGINNIAPQFEYSGTSTDDNYSLAAVGNNSVWHHNSDEFIYLFSGVMADEDNAQPTLTLEVESGDSVYEVSYDEERNILYGYVYVSGGDDYIAIFDDATNLEDGDGPTRVFSGFEGELFSLVVDPRADRLFVFHETEVSEEWEYHVFNNVSTLEGGNQSGIDHLVIDFDFDDEFYGASYDFKNDRLWVTNYGGSYIYIIDNASNPGEELVIRTLRETPATRDEYSPSYWQTIYDTVRDRLFITDYSGERVLIYENASQISGNSTSRDADISVEGANTLLGEPDGIVLFR